VQRVRLRNLDQGAIVSARQQAQRAADELAARLTGHVAAKLGCAVSFVCWRRLPCGADLPIFRVPPDRVAAARALRLTVEEGR
jgi:hypothetical protein